MKSRWQAWIPVVLWMTVIYIGSTDLLASRHTSRIIGPVLRFFFPEITDDAIRGVQVVVRKAGHVTEYAILALLLLRALAPGVSSDVRDQGPLRVSLVRAWLLATAYAGTDEFHQSFVSTRHGSVRDVVIDSMGAALALVCVAWGLRGRDRSR